MTPVEIAFPFTGVWLARNSPARKVPSHGSHLLGTTYSIDFIKVHDNGRTAPWGWASAFGTEHNEQFPGFGRPALSPVDGQVVAVLDGIEDHVTRRSQLHLAGYMLSQFSRFRRGGPNAISGNYVAVRIHDGPIASVFHLKNGTVRVAAGEHVRAGDQVGECGNSGNSTQPHVHVQVTDTADFLNCTGLPMIFRRPGKDRSWMPQENEVFQA